MLKKDVIIGGQYVANVSGKRTIVRIDNTHAYGGWTATNITTGRQIRIKTAGRLHGRHDPDRAVNMERARAWVRACRSRHTYPEPESFVEAMDDGTVREMLTDLKRFKWSDRAVVAKGLIRHAEARLAGSQS